MQLCTYFLILITCWFICKVQNEELFFDIPCVNWHIINPIKSQLEATIESFGSAKVGHNERLVSWIPPLGDTVKLNVDGSSFENPGYGRLINDSLCN